MLHLSSQMANTALKKPSKRAPCLDSQPVSVFTSSLGCETASGKAPAVGLPGEENIASWLGPGQQALAAWVKDQATDPDLKAEGCGARESV